MVPPERELVAGSLSRPWTYARVKLGMALHPKQEAVLRDWFAAGSRTVFRCGNEVGKTSHVGVAAILHHAEILKGLVVSTAGVQRQVKTQLIPALQMYRGGFPGWKFNDDSIYDAKGRLRYLGFTAANEGNFQGFHNLDGPLGIILDESAAIKDKIIIAAEERCNPVRLLMMGSPMDPIGQFYQSCAGQASFYKQHKLTQPECPWIDKAAIQRRIDKYGPEHPIVLSSIYAEFCLKVEGALLSLREWEDCIADPPAERGHERHVFLDFAAGRARNSIGVRVGNRVWIHKSWREKNVLVAIATFVSELNKLAKPRPAGIGLKPHEVEGDADGMGVTFCQAIQEAGWPLQLFHGNGKPLLNQEYRNRISEVWSEGTVGIRNRQWIIAPPGSAPDDQVNQQMNEQLKAQLIVRKLKRDILRGKLAIESKEDMAGRGIESPDDGDALLGAMAPCPHAGSASGPAAVTEWSSSDEPERYQGGIEGGCV